MRVGDIGGAAPDGDKADLHALAFDHRAFGGGIDAADLHARELRDIERKAAVARLGRTLVFRLWLAHALPLRPSPSARARAGTACGARARRSPRRPRSRSPARRRASPSARRRSGGWASTSA